LPIATVATEIPAGICTVASSASSPFKDVAGIGTPITGNMVCAAITPARCACASSTRDDHPNPRCAAFGRNQQYGQANDAPT